MPRKRVKLVDFIACCAVLFTVLACGATHTAAPTEAPMNKPTNDLLLHLDQHHGAVVEVTTGVEHYQKGKVRLDVHGDGKLDVVNVRAGKESTSTGRLDAKAVRAFGVLVAAVSPGTLKSPTGTREPGDSPVVIRVLDGGTVLASASVWYADRYDNAALDQVIEQYDTIVSKVTNGALPY